MVTPRRLQPARHLCIGAVADHPDVRTFHGDLLAVASWLVVEREVTHVAMESTGLYWWPVYSALREVGGAGAAV